MKLAEVIEINSGGKGSSCNPDKGKCGRPSKGGGTPSGPGIVRLVLPRHQIELSDKEFSAAKTSQVLTILGPKLTKGENEKVLATLKKQGYNLVGDKGFGPILWNSKKAARLEVRFLKQ